MENWEIVAEMNDENDNPTCWGLEMEELIDGTTHHRYIWISLSPENLYNVELLYSHHVVVLNTFKTLAGAKRWVKKYLSEK